jgi:hypothetical protein
VAAVLLNKFLDGRSTSFARCGGSFVVSVNGQERTVSRDLWRSLPELEAAERDPAHHVASARTRPGSTNRARHRVKFARGQWRLDYWVRIVSVRSLDHQRVVAE